MKLPCGEFFKRALCLVLTFVMLLTLAPVFPHAHAAEGTTVYLKPNANWLMDGARFAIYYWNGSGSAWSSMADADGDGYYEGTVPAGYTNVIFCRMNPGSSTNDWNNKWNQTSDLTLSGDNNCYTVKEGTWDNGGGEWSKLTFTVSYAVSYQLTNVTASNTASTIDEGTAYATTLSAEEGYALPASVSVTVGGAAVTVSYAKSYSSIF